MSKQFLAVLAAIIIAFVGIFMLTADNGKTDSKSSNGKSSGSSLSQNVQGKGTSGVTLVEYGDYQCPYCQQYYPTVKLIRAEFGDQIKFQFRNFPLVNIHQNAFAASRAAEAAALQGKFWEMHDALYETSNWQVWTAAKDPTSDFKQYAKQLGLNASKFTSDFASSKVNDTINADTAEGTKLGITGTPTFFINGKKVEVTNNISDFQKEIKAAIANKAASAKQN
ncbi:MAG: thioredoxin domain-containing protein [Patescibacteria group bacterium]